MSTESGPGATAAATADPRQRALARMLASRQQLRAQWLPAASSGRPAAATAGGLSRRLGALLRQWRMRLATVPLAGLALDAAARWWQHNPWRVAGETVADELQQAVTPWVRRHPVAAVALAAAAGVALAVAKPWRWPWLADPLRSAPARVGRWALGELGKAPLQSLIAGLVLAAGSAASAAPRAAADEAPTPGPQSP